jgi:hypothetical protein
MTKYNPAGQPPKQAIFMPSPVASDHNALNSAIKKSFSLAYLGYNGFIIRCCEKSLGIYCLALKYISSLKL